MLLLTERRSWQAFLIDQIANGIACPRVTHCYRIFDFRAGDYHGIAVNTSFGRQEAVVRARDGESCQASVASHGEPAADMVEPHPSLIAFGRELAEDRTGVDQAFFVGDGPRRQREPVADVLFVSGMDVVRCADIDYNSHAGINQIESFHLRFPQHGPFALRPGLKIRKLDEQERESSLSQALRQSSMRV